MKAIKLIIMFIVVLGGVLGGIFLVTSGGDVLDPSPDTNVLPDTTTTEDTANSSAPLPGAQDEDKVDPNRETEQAEETKMETASGNAPLPGAQDEDKVDPNRETEQAEEIKMETASGNAPLPGAQDENKGGPTREGKANSSKDGTKRMYTCNRCGPNIWFRTAKELQNHISIKHHKSAGKTTKFVCDQCGRCFESQYILRSHKVLTHMDR